MKWHCVLLTLALLGLSAPAQTTAIGTANAALPALLSGDGPIPSFDGPAPECFTAPGGPDHAGGRFLTGNHKFPGFIGYISNPLFAIDPRAQTEMYPIFASSWFKSFPALPDGNFQLYGAGLNIALSERLSVGLNQGGYAVSHLQPGSFVAQTPILADRAQDRSRDGWLNLGGFIQYTLIEDVPNQFLLTTGLHLEVPTGEAEVFQGHGPVKMAPYFTIGKELGDFHVLTTTGYLFPTGSAHLTNLFYGTVHLDRRMFGWLYPLVEFNWAYHTASTDLNVPDLPNFFSFGNFDSSGNIVTMSAGFNAVLKQDRLEFGAVYTTSLATQHDIDINGLLVKMVMRY